MPEENFRMPGVFNSQEILVAEAVQARAWELLRSELRPALGADKARLGGIVLRLLSTWTTSRGDLAAEAARLFHETADRR